MSATEHRGSVCQSTLAELCAHTSSATPRPVRANHRNTDWLVCNCQKRIAGLPWHITNSSHNSSRQVVDAELFASHLSRGLGFGSGGR
eukprot:1318484-Pleurochrysis_carterae.AAC.2